jgi:hypothetical protein
MSFSCGGKTFAIDLSAMPAFGQKLMKIISVLKVKVFNKKIIKGANYPTMFFFSRSLLSCKHLIWFQVGTAKGGVM